MMLFGKKKNKIKFDAQYDPELQIPIMHCSICNGEQVLGFKDKKTGKMTEVLCVKNSDDLMQFLDYYGLSESDIIKEY